MIFYTPFNEGLTLKGVRMSENYLIDRLNDYIHDCEEDITYWERQRTLARKKVDLCNEAIELCQNTLNKYRKLVGEALIGNDNSN